MTWYFTPAPPAAVRPKPTWRMVAPRSPPDVLGEFIRAAPLRPTGATVVTGNTWAKPNDVDFSNLRVGGSVYIATDTLIGPVFLAVGAADRGRSAFYLFVGKPF